MKDWYDILGVPSSADPVLIRATYRSLVKVYHPDVFLGDKNFAEKKLKELNEAFEILSDPQKRKNYDDEFRRSKSFDHGSAFSSENFSDEFNTFHNIMEERWQVALDYLPHLDELFKRLAKIDRKLAFVFQAFLLETQEFAEAEKFSEILLSEYLEKKFGKNKNVHNLVLSAIDSGDRKFASDLNKALNIVGEKSLESVLMRLSEKHREFSLVYYPIHGFEKLVLPIDTSRKDATKGNDRTKHFDISEHSKKGNPWKARWRWSLVILLIGLPVYIVVCVTILNALPRLPMLVEFLVYILLGVIWLLPFKFIFRGAPEGKSDRVTQPPDPQIKQSRAAPIVILVSFAVWMGASWIGGKIGLPVRFAFLLDMTALVAFFWALTVLIWGWWKRR